MENKGLIRPRTCLDSECEVLWSDFLPEYAEKGYSFQCIGKLIKPHEFIWKEVTHRNDFCLCLYSPLKGAIKFLMDINDIREQMALLNMALKSVGKVLCSECGGEGVYYHTVGEKNYCPMCALRIGLFYWDKESKIYVWSHDKYKELGGEQ